MNLSGPASQVMKQGLCGGEGWGTVTLPFDPTMATTGNCRSPEQRGLFFPGERVPACMRQPGKSVFTQENEGSSRDIKCLNLWKVIQSAGQQDMLEPPSHWWWWLPHMKPSQLSRLSPYRLLTFTSQHSSGARFCRAWIICKLGSYFRKEHKITNSEVRSRGQGEVGSNDPIIVYIYE